jgi:hypothetical protein
VSESLVSLASACYERLQGTAGGAGVCALALTV